jgi:hypothetical protein
MTKRNDRCESSPRILPAAGKEAAFIHSSLADGTVFSEHGNLNSLSKPMEGLSDQFC